MGCCSCNPDFHLEQSWPPVATTPLAVDEKHAALLRRLRTFAVAPGCIAAATVVLIAAGGVTSNRVGLLLGSLCLTSVLVVTSTIPGGRTLSHAAKVHHFLSVFLVFAISGMTLGAYTTGLRCSAATTRMYVHSLCATLWWETALQSLLALVAMQQLQVARRLEAGMLLAVVREQQAAAAGAPPQASGTHLSKPPAGAAVQGKGKTTPMQHAIMTAPLADVDPEKGGSPPLKGVLIRTTTAGQ
jgi:hypothetical protein